MARSSASFLPTPKCSRTASVIWLPMVNTGLRLLIGSWKIIAISLPRSARISLFRQRQQVPALEQDAPEAMSRGRHVQQPHDGHRGHGLAAAGLPHDAQRLDPCGGREDDAVDGLDHAVHDVEVGPQVPDVEQQVRIDRCLGRGAADGACAAGAVVIASLRASAGRGRHAGRRPRS